MEKKIFIMKIISGACIFCFAGMLVFYITLVNSTNKIIGDKDQKISTLTKQNKALDSKYNELYKQKNDNANEQLLKATNVVFSSLFDYDTTKDSIKDRREKASKFTTEEALETVLPKEATTYNASVKSVSKIKGKPQVYFEPSSDKKQKVLVIIDNEIVIDNNYPTEAKWQYEATFDTDKNVFVELKMLGELQQLDKKDN
ncbi:hypothetical protein EFM07_12250 [Lactococcus lactis]|uniref:hypothetical protein n=1 Tax=Lactococcus lactis TaxID=1358 RepID=UPI00223B7114|nr:hypothetical protein [Lactococcus lactis]MCT1228127.1 hypothetical protein [Lactococcus lactis]